MCPDIILSRYLAITSYDCGIYQPTSEELAEGWRIKGDVVYTPPVQSIASLHFQRDGLDCPGYDEWYTFQKEPGELGQIYHGNPFEGFHPIRGVLEQFVPWPAFLLHEQDASFSFLFDWFWKQLEWIQPESYLADGEDCFTFVCQNKALFDEVSERISHRKVSNELSLQ